MNNFISRLRLSKQFAIAREAVRIPDHHATCHGVMNTILKGVYLRRAL